MIEIEIDGKILETTQGSMIIEVADKAGIPIPRFCYHKKLSIAANCRMCLVEVEKAPKPLPACATPVTPGMKVFTNSVKAVDAQKSVMEFLLINHPLDCPICDQGGACELQDISMGYGQDFSRYEEVKRSVKDENLGPLVATDMTRCIQCTRCVRFGQEIADLRELGTIGRHDRMEIGTYLKNNGLKSELSGNVIDLCPVGALTSKPFRFKARAWELTQSPSIAPHDCVGSNIYLQTLRGKVMRVVPRENEAVNESWISDRDRFSYEGLYSEDRLIKPMIKENNHWKEVDWAQALDAAAKQLRKLSGPEIAAFASPNSTVEEFYLLQKFMRGIGSSNIDHRLHAVDLSDQFFMPLFPGLSISIEDIEKQKAILIVGSNLKHEAPLLAHRVRKAAAHGANVLYIDVDNLEKVSFEPNLILLGAQAHNHPHASTIRRRVQQLAIKHNAVLGYVTEGANTAGAWIAGCVPHRGPYGEQITPAGCDIHQSLSAKLKAYILLNIEPDHDCANPNALIDNLKSADSVIALTAYKTNTLLDTATVLLPISPYAETSGTYINIEGRVQSFEPATPSLGESRPAWKILRVLANLFKLDGFDYTDSESVRDELLQLEKKSKRPDPVFPEIKLSQKSDIKVPEWKIYQSDSIVRRGKALQKVQL
ncbi:MAG: NADH-quinone oxidoreductase subunit NuoG [Gammaproteobacteria bacterium]|nr:NADH-quinone oxidoreductase subunit NuoG [Gammaproteobacteria bacterium]